MKFIWDILYRVSNIKPSYKSKHTTTLPRTAWIRIPDAHEAIIPLEEFRAVEERLQRHTRSGGEGRTHRLSGLVFCMHCQKPLAKVRSRYQGNMKNYLRCTNPACIEKGSVSIRLDHLEQIVFSQIQEIFQDHELHAELSTLLKGMRKTDEAQLQAEIMIREKAVQRLYLDLAAGRIEQRRFEDCYQAFCKQIDALAEKKAAAPRLFEADIQRQITTFCESREAAHLLIERIVIERKNGRTQCIRIIWNGCQ